MKPGYLALLFPIFMLPAFNANAAGSMLRVTCEGDDVGAEVLINGKFKGECPMDVQVPAGVSKLLVQKKINNEDYLFEQDIRMGDGGVKRVEVRLVNKAFLLNIKKAEAGDIASMRLLQATYKNYVLNGNGNAKYNEEQCLKWTRKLAELGEGHAMFELGQAYQKGMGVEKNMDEANRWYRSGFETLNKEAEGGDIVAMVYLGVEYAKGRGVPENREKAAMWLRRAKDKGDEMVDRYLKLYKLQ